MPSATCAHHAGRGCPGVHCPWKQDGSRRSVASTELPVFRFPLSAYLCFWAFLCSAKIGLGLSPLCPDPPGLESECPGALGGARALHILHLPQNTCSGPALKVDRGRGKQGERGALGSSSVSQHNFSYSPWPSWLAEAQSE